MMRWSQRDLVTEDTSNALAELALAAREAFPDALETLTRKSLLVETRKPDGVIWKIKGPGESTSSEYDHLKSHPKEVLALLDRIVSIDAEPWGFDELKEILYQIKNSEGIGPENQLYRKLMDRVSRG